MKTKHKLCAFCGRKAAVGATSHAENPFCQKCLDQRVREASEQLGPVTWRRNGHFLQLIPKNGTVA